MKIDVIHIDKINEYFESKGMIDPDTNLELWDHLYSIIEEEKLESELIPTDTLSLTEH